jgi:hypothetical protein
MSTEIAERGSAGKADKKVKFTVRSADGETAKENVSLGDTLQSVLDKFVQKTHFSVAANQIPYFEFEGRRYEDLTQPVRVIEGLEDDDTIALLIRPRSG